MTSNGKQPNGCPRVTVALPTYNRATYLRGALDSVLAQTFTDFVVVVSDNASTDETREVVESYDDPRVVYRVQEHNRGWLANFNAALSGADTDYGIFLSDDDLLRPRLLERAVAVLDEHPQVSIFHSAFDIIDGSGTVRVPGMDWTGHLPEDTQERGSDFIRLSMSEGCRVCSSTAVLRLSGVPWPAYEPNAGFPADLLLYLRMAIGHDLYFAREALGAYRVHEGSISAGEWANVVTGQYRPKVSAILQLRRVKLRFLRESGSRLEDVRSLRYDAERAAVDAYLNHVVRPNIPQPVRRAVKALVPGRARAAQVP
jgi:glycosyltransferase involved in cell wall biosynthesis